MRYRTFAIVASSAALAFVTSASAEPPTSAADEHNSIRAPATPLIACDPYFSVWSSATRLTDADTIHWTGKPHRLTSLVSINGKSYRLIGREPSDIPALNQTSSTISPTQTRYQFSGAGIDLEISFTTPALPDDIDKLSRPITYLTYKVNSSDGQPKDVRLYFEVSAGLTVNTPDQIVTGGFERPGDLVALKMGSQDQDILGRKGDDLRIDWGYVYLATPVNLASSYAIDTPDKLRKLFIDVEPMPQEGTVKPTRADELSAALVLELGAVDSKSVTRWLMLAYDDLYSIEYMHHRLRPIGDETGSTRQGFYWNPSVIFSC